MSGVRLDNTDIFERVGAESYGRPGEETGATDTKENAPHYTIQGVLHFLQTEWNRLEMQRSQWEVERAELQVNTADYLIVYIIFYLARVSNLLSSGS